MVRPRISTNHAWGAAQRAGLVLLLAAVLLCNAGCLVVAATAACAGGAAAGYAYVQGRVSREYPVGQEPTRQAVRTALAELQLPLEKEEATREGLTLYSRTGDDRKIRIDLETEAKPVPSEGVTTRVGIRVAVLGDEAVSQRILDQVDLHLVPAAQGRGPTPPPLAQPARLQPVAAQPPALPATSGRLQPVAAETVAPPVAPPLVPVPAQPPVPRGSGQ